jgi:hypothetical protein
MALASWWHGDPVPQLPELDGFQVVPAHDDTELARLNHISVQEARARRAAGHQPYLGVLNGTPVAYGWSASRAASIGELDLTFTLAHRERYLWDFVTLPEWQGRGIYPHLLQGIIAHESATAERFWIIHAPENLPSGAGMGKAGLTPVGRLSYGEDGRVVLALTGAEERGRAGAVLLGVRLVDGAASPCWHCGGAHECSGDPCPCATPIRHTASAPQGVSGRVMGVSDSAAR